MIIYDLKCEKGHSFEGWFQDQQAWNLQKSQKLVSCPACNSSNVEIVPSSITIMGKDSRTASKFQEKEISPDVGNKFAEVALKIHCGEEEKRNIKGTTTPQEENSLKEEGVQFIKIPMLKMDS